MLQPGDHTGSAAIRMAVDQPKEGQAQCSLGDRASVSIKMAIAASHLIAITGSSTSFLNGDRKAPYRWSSTQCVNGCRELKAQSAVHPPREHKATALESSSKRHLGTCQSH
jgi:hypothetical protein